MDSGMMLIEARIDVLLKRTQFLLAGKMLLMQTNPPRLKPEPDPAQPENVFRNQT